MYLRDLFSSFSEVLLVLWIVSFITANGYELKDCPRTLSNEASNLVQDKFLPAFVAHNSKPLDSCPILPHNSQYHLQESHVERKSKYYVCGFCEKEFISYDYISLHMDLKHEDKIHDTDTSHKHHCLANYCYMFHCEGFEKMSKRMATNQKFICEMTMDQCVPDQETTASQKLLKELKDQFCDVSNLMNVKNVRVAPWERDVREIQYWVLLIGGVIGMFGAFWYYLRIIALQLKTKVLAKDEFGDTLWKRALLRMVGFDEKKII
eukprot:TRINITY_DN7307_c0_g1_i1.p1 TRINITY_DN7307_c0_g1~~TRINITY_DN7307_c0_g1_i1.p1  ORF type:complete len:264 (+),score=37.82 TRINITY_DN7307_c0_g1_i1:60-851(+)